MTVKLFAVQTSLVLATTLSFSVASHAETCNDSQSKSGSGSVSVSSSVSMVDGKCVKGSTQATQSTQRINSRFNSSFNNDWSSSFWRTENQPSTINEKRTRRSSRFETNWASGSWGSQSKTSTINETPTRRSSRFESNWGSSFSKATQMSSRFEKVCDQIQLDNKITGWSYNGQDIAQVLTTKESLLCPNESKYQFETPALYASGGELVKELPVGNYSIKVIYQGDNLYVEDGSANQLQRTQMGQYSKSINGVNTKVTTATYKSTGGVVRIYGDANTITLHKLVVR
ncbi:hypothetical protein [Zooshikella ganghwensis]|uniref:Uncharacterized protein n=1 Tax=Zooshikella ganghwensis TaxID=202772 RepID=A0A4P9VID6_9GAMM|nr:hypothetical protein [Zooshikella ganghwensis]RDH41402.1 hypothetical protein B9G39_28505 [Zooshikella ganghwensis]RDH41887.1 hypothetical protein B9G39_26070 [Zooshikella ganghwensis]RDH43729.1 hypothetical protein B9G39_09900 [Zooshikella ganghwensis]